MQSIWIDAAEFKNYGGWKLETQFIREMAQPYLVAADIPGTPVENADTEFEVESNGYYRFFVRTKNWKLPEAPGRFKLVVDGKELKADCEKMPALYWYWEIADDVYLTKGKHSLSVADKSGWLSRFAAVIITNDFNFTPSPENSVMLKQRAEIKNIDTTPLDKGRWDYVVVGAGPGGVSAAISAARNGLKTALICARPFVGGNASVEGTIGMDGAGGKCPGNHETGIANEVKRVHEHFGMSWQEAFEYLIAKEPNLTLFSNEMCIGANTDNCIINSVECVNTITLKHSIFHASLFADCSADGWLGYYAGAKYRIGRDAKHEFNERLAPDSPDTLKMSGCICGFSEKLGKHRGFYAADAEKEVPFKSPSWAIKLPEGDALCRTPKSESTPDWWLENSNDFDDLWDSEFARDEMVRLAVGYFDWLKNSYTGKDNYKNKYLKCISLHNSKRENRRLIGDYILNQNDYTKGKTFPDTVSYTGWGIDVHHIKGIYSGSEGAFHANEIIPVSPVPYRCLYSINIKNLFFASRGASFSHVALGSTRVGSTLSTLGQAIGTAAMLCKKYGVMPRDIYNEHIKELQQTLLKQDQTIPGIVNEDCDDLARCATVTATSVDTNAKGFAENVINGKIRSTDEECNAWISKEDSLPQSITLKLKEPAEISEIHITAETDLTYPRYCFQPAPEFLYTARDITVEVICGDNIKTVGEITHNFTRKHIVKFKKTKTEKVKITVHSASGSNVAKIN